MIKSINIMAIKRITVYSLYVMIWLTQSVCCRADFCEDRKPVVKICTEDTLFMQTSANIDTAEAPKLQQSSCKCTLSPTHRNVFFFFYYYKSSANMEFKIKGAMLDRKFATNMRITGDTDLLFTTTEFATDGACLIVSNQVSKFNVTCTTGTTKVTTDPSTSTSMKDVAVPVVASVSGLVCLAIVVSVILYRRKIVSCRRVSTPRSSKAETKNENDYYMTENPMYNMTDTPQNTHVSENEYSFVEDENQEDGITSNQYESLPDSPVGTRISSKPSGEDQEYDYTVCSSASRKYKTADGKQNKTEVKQGKSLPNDKTNVNETVYDRTDVVAKQFNGFNEYSHLPNTVSKKAADDTYNTLGNSYKT